MRIKRNDAQNFAEKVVYVGGKGECRVCWRNGKCIVVGRSGDMATAWEKRKR